VLAAGLPRQDHVLINTKQFVRLHKNSFNEMLCKLDSSEYARSFEQNLALLEDPRDCSGLSTFDPVIILTGLASRPCRCWSTRFFFFFQH
jgi:thiamine pyrophosphokinase